MVKAEHIKKVAGRETASRAQDVEWIGDLLRHGLLRGVHSERPAAGLARLDALSHPVDRRTHQRSEPAAEGAGRSDIKLASVVTDVTGVSGRAILGALLMGHAAPAEMAELAKGRLRQKHGELGRALEGVLQLHQRFMVVELLEHIDC